MADARTEILAAVRAANAGRQAPQPISRQYQRFSAYSDVVGLFDERVADYQATVHRCGETEIAATVETITARRDVGELVVPTDLPAEWLPASLGRIAEPLTVAELDAAPGVVTGCAVAIAETGTIVLDSGVAQGRRAVTLVPDYHLCVVFAAQIAGSVPEALERLDPVRPLTFISGPSATSDIELERVEGVHGPRTLDVLIVG